MIFDRERAVRDAREGSMIASVALSARVGEGTDWPQEYRNAALAEYTTTEEDIRP